MLTHRSIARKNTRLWQAGAVAVVALAGGAIALPLSSVLAPPSVPTELPTPKPTPPAPPPSVAAADIAATAELLRAMSPIVEAPKVDVATKPATPDPKAPAPDAPVASGEWVYLGSAITPVIRHALVRIDGQQQMVAEGDEYKGTRLVEVKPEEILIQSGGAKKTVQLTHRATGWPTDAPKRPVAFRPAPAAGALGPAGMVANIPGMVPGAAGKVVIPPAPQTFDQARSAAAAHSAALQAQQLQQQQQAALQAQQDAEVKAKQMAELREKGGPELGGENAIGADVALKMITDPGSPEEDRLRALARLGVTPGLPPDDAFKYIKAQGIDPSDPSVMSLLKLNAERGQGSQKGGG